ncbi:MAG: hypothetical protein WA987_08995 [Cellvibrio sp.]
MDMSEISLSPARIAAICGVSIRTAQRWIAGHSKPKRAALELLRLHEHGRIMPDKWPHSWLFNRSGYLETGHKRALAWQQIDWYFFSIECWHRLLDLIPKIEQRLDALAKVSPPAVVVDLQKYRDELKRLKERPFALPADLREYYQIAERETHRKTGC